MGLRQWATAGREWLSWTSWCCRVWNKRQKNSFTLISEESLSSRFFWERLYFAGRTERLLCLQQKMLASQLVQSSFSSLCFKYSLPLITVPFRPSPPVQPYSTVILGHVLMDVDHLLPEVKATSILHQAARFRISPRRNKKKYLEKINFCNHLYPLLGFNFLDLDLWKCHMTFIDMPFLISIPFSSFSFFIFLSNVCLELSTGRSGPWPDSFDLFRSHEKKAWQNLPVSQMFSSASTGS